MVHKQSDIHFLDHKEKDFFGHKEKDIELNSVSLYNTPLYNMKFSFHVVVPNFFTLENFTKEL